MSREARRHRGESTDLSGTRTTESPRHPGGGRGSIRECAPMDPGLRRGDKQFRDPVYRRVGGRVMLRGPQRRDACRRADDWPQRGGPMLIATWSMAVLALAACGGGEETCTQEEFVADYLGATAVEDCGQLEARLDPPPEMRGEFLAGRQCVAGSGCRSLATPAAARARLLLGPSGGRAAASRTSATATRCSRISASTA